MERITKKHLETLCWRLNGFSGSPNEPYSNGKANVGNFHIDYAYGGCKIVRMVNESGGVTNITEGYRPKREVMDLGRAVLEGMMIAKEGTK